MSERTTKHDLRATLPWLADGTAFLLAGVGRLSDEELRAPSGLSGWSRAHVIAHVARNAEALARLATWARTGVEMPMYADSQQRNTEIDVSATQPAAALRDDLAGTATALDGALAALDDTGWQAEVRSAQGRVIPAVEIAWLRVREVWLHTVDLAAGATVADLPDALVDTLLDDVTGALSDKDQCPAAVLRPSDRDRTWRLGVGDTEPVAVSGSAADVAAWLVGRAAGAGPHCEGALPVVPRWL